MLRIIAWIVGGIVALVALLIVVAVAALFLLDWNMFRDEVEEMASALLGRDVQLEGLDVDPGWSVTRIYVRGLSVANAEWGEADRLVQLGEGEVAIKPWPLLWGRTEIPEIILTEPRLHLEVNKKGTANWDFGAPADVAGEAVSPDTRFEFPVIGRLLLREGTLSYHDAMREMALEGTIATGEGDAAATDRLDLSLKGSLENKPVTFRFSGGSILQLRETDEPYPVDLALDVGDTSVRAEGTVVEPVEMRGFDLAFSIEGPSLAEVFPIFGAPLPPTPPYRLSASLAHEGEVWRLNGMEGRVGDSDLAGTIALDQGGKVPFLKADLVSQKVDLKDLAGLVGGTPEGSDEPAQQEGVFPDRPIAADRLNAMNMNVRFDGQHVIAEDLPIDQLRFRIQVQDGRAEANPLSMAIAGGTVAGELALNGRQDVPSADADLAFENLDLKPFFADTQFMQQMGGRFFGHVYVLGVGHTMSEMAGTARGEGWFGIKDGSISGLLVEAAGLDVVEALALVIGEDARIGLRCGRLDLQAAEGTVKVDNAVVDTTDSLLVAAGEVNLGQETFDMQIEARAKDFSLIDVAAPVRVYGELESPSFSIGGLDPLPFFEMGDQEDVDCNALLSDRLHLKPSEGN